MNYEMVGKVVPSVEVSLSIGGSMFMATYTATQDAK